MKNVKNMLSFNDFSSALPKMSFLPPEESLEQAEDSTSQSKSVEQKPSVLIFSSDRDTRFLFGTLLEIWNFDFTEAETVEQSFRIAESRLPDLILMDIKIAFSNSFSEMRRMQKSGLFKKVPFILISGHAQSDVRLMALAAGAADFFVKPVNLDQLENTLKSRLFNTNHVSNLGDLR